MLSRRQSYGRNRGMGGMGGGRNLGKSRLIIALVLVGFSLFSYYGSKEFNPVTGENQYIGMTPKQEIALGIQAAPQMIQQHGGLHPDNRLQAVIDQIGNELVRNSAAAKTGWKFDFHLLRDDRTVNAFALPGGQIFITMALYQRLKTRGQVAGVLGHEIGHVVARHSAQRMAKSNLTQGITQAVLVASDPSSGSAQVAQMIGQMINMKYGREDELESDHLGVRFMSKSGYDPRSMITVMKVLAEASGGQRQPEFASTHPSPENRISEINESIRQVFPNGVPGNMKQ